MELSEGKKFRDAIIESSPLLKKVFEMNEADRGKKSVETIKSPKLEHGREVEHRYLASAEDGILNDNAELDEDLVLALRDGASKPDEPAVFKRHIEQRYIYTYPTGNKKEPLVFRLRKTHLYEGKDKVVRTLYRVACKSHVDGNPNARVETQVIIDPTDPSSEEELKEFNRLWELSGAMMKQTKEVDYEETFSFDRYYYRHKLPIEDQDDTGKPIEHWCEMHIERRKAPPPELEGMVRIEVEYENDFDELFARNNPAALPKWVGPDKTEDKRYKSRRMARKGPPKEYAEHMTAIREQRQKRARESASGGA